MDLLKYREKNQADGRDVWGELAEKIGTSKAYISQVAHGHRKGGLDFCRKVEQATDGEITRADLRPDFLGDISEVA